MSALLCALCPIHQNQVADSETSVCFLSLLVLSSLILHTQILKHNSPWLRRLATFKYRHRVLQTYKIVQKETLLFLKIRLYRLMFSLLLRKKKNHGTYISVPSVHKSIHSLLQTYLIFLKRHNTFIQNWQTMSRCSAVLLSKATTE